MVSVVAAFWILLGAASSTDGLTALPGETVVESFDAEALPQNMKQNNTEAAEVDDDDGRALRVKFKKVDWPNVFFTPPEGTWDWSAFAGIAVDVYNPEREPVDVCMRVDNEGADGANFCNTGSVTAHPQNRTTLLVYFNTGDTGPFWGMRGVPEKGAVAQGSTLDPSRITAFQVFLPRPQRSHTLILDNIRLFGRGGPLAELVPLPFVDRFGQYIHAEWSGKLKDENELDARRQREERELESAQSFPNRDRFGGWTDGLKLEGTGWFRTEKVNGKWWLVTPEGMLFFSLGVDCVGTWERTFIDGRDGWFEWLPKEEGLYKELFGHTTRTHSMAEPIGGKGRTFSFYCANLIRKYGDDWKTAWRNTAYARLRSWGFNTIGNWSQADVLDRSPMPFVATASVGGDFRRIEGATGYWGKMADVFDPKFAESAESSISGVAKRYADNPLCIGYFVDNELSWQTIRTGTLASPPEQPCRVELVHRLKDAYGTLEGVNKAWGTNAEDWESLRVPKRPNDACKQDLDQFVYTFARRYFDTVKQALHRRAPNQLYVGCRFSTAPQAVIRACAEVADVVSFNLYRRTIAPDAWTGENDLGKPIIIGEFHFGALDRGMFHTGLVSTRHQRERAESYVRYVRSVAANPAFVGCHWFQYIDEPITGRFWDGENYNIGFITVVDSPYPELVEAAKKVHAEIYERRWSESRR